MAKIKFERVSAPTGSVEFTYNPKYGDYNRRYKMNQIKEVSAGKVVYAYNKGNDEEIITLKFSNIPESDISNFLTFVINVVQGATNTCTYTDYKGDTHTVRIWNAENILSSPVGLDQEDLTIVLRIE